MHKHMTRRLLSRTFLNAMAEELSLPHWHSDSQKLLIWKYEEALYTLRLTELSAPSTSTDARLSVVRISINYYAFWLTHAACRQLGLPRSSALRHLSGQDKRCRLEWTVLGEELIDFAPWLLSWLELKTEQAWTAPPPPHASYIWGCGLREIEYAWTVAAWNAHARNTGRAGVFFPFVTCIAPPPSDGRRVHHGRVSSRERPLASQEDAPGRSIGERGALPASPVCAANR